MRQLRAIRAIIAALIVCASSTAGGAPSDDPIVLVLKLISSTHARPVTGLVLKRSPDESDGAAPALVMVPANFVSAGDEIVVLDGGTDILRDRRTTRTIARSASVGVAVLEVEGLQRSGVALSADTWPPAPGSMLKFEAWPAADALAEGAPRTRTEVRLTDVGNGAGALTEPALPGFSGPLFDRCGRLAGWHVAGAETRIVGAETLGEFTGGSGLEIDRRPCAASPPELARAGAGAGMEQAAGQETPVEQPPGPGFSAEISPGEDAAGISPETVAPPERGRRRVAAVAAMAAALVALTLYLGHRGRRKVQGPVLEGRDESGAAVRIPLGLGPEGGSTRLEHRGVHLVFKLQDGRLLVGDAGDASGPLALAVAGTACLPGESMYVADGEEVLIADGRLVVRLGLPRDTAGADKA